MVLREEAWKEQVTKYMGGKCKEDGTQMLTNLTKREKAGMKSLIKRRDNGEIVITVGDKCKRLSVSSIKSYREQGLVHTKLGKKCGWPEIRKACRRVTAVSRGFCNCVQIGMNGSDNDAKRTFDNYNTYACVIPVLKVLPKSHKPLREDGNPQTRPVVGAYSCMTSRASKHICDMIAGMHDKTSVRGGGIYKYRRHG